jgi:hypothetical protein
MHDDRWEALAWEELPWVATPPAATWVAFRLRLLDGEGHDGLWCRVSLNPPLPRPDVRVALLRQNASITYSRDVPFRALAAPLPRGLCQVHVPARGHEMPFLALLPAMKGLLLLMHLP